MTNEDLAIQIQLGHTEHYTELWENVKRLMLKILHSKTKRIVLPTYLDKEDIEQELYFAFCNAVQAYDDTKPYKFNSYLEYHIMNAVCSALPSKPLQEVSLNQAVGEDEENELLELVEDEAAAQDFKQVELTDLQTDIRQAISQLPTMQAKTIYLFYFRNMQYKLISKALGNDIKTTQKTKQKGLYNLSRNRKLKNHFTEMQRHYEGHESKGYYYISKM